LEFEGRGRIGFEGYYTSRQALDRTPTCQQAVPTCCSAGSWSGSRWQC